MTKTKNKISGNNNSIINIINKNTNNVLKNKMIAIFIIAILVVSFTMFVVKMFDNIDDNITIKPSATLDTEVTNDIDNKMPTKIKLETNQGNIIIELYDDMPITAGNFEKLVKQGFYDGIIFHRIINNFMIQGGDPTGTGMGGPGYKIDDEFVAGHSNIRGTLSMANSGPNSGGSQFFINLVDNSQLDYDDMRAPQSKHPVFGEVIEGMDIVDKIASVATDASDKPIKEVVIIRASIN